MFIFRFLVPALNIVYIETVRIAWNSSVCQATSDTIVSFTVDPGKDNTPAMVWMSYSHIKSTEIPKLAFLLDETKNDLAAELNKPFPNKELVAVLRKRESKVQAGYQGWIDTLARHDQVELDAKDGNLTSVAIMQKSSYVSSCSLLCVCDTEKVAFLFTCLKNMQAANW